MQKTGKAVMNASQARMLDNRMSLRYNMPHSLADSGNCVAQASSLIRTAPQIPSCNNSAGERGLILDHSGSLNGHPPLAPLANRPSDSVGKRFTNLILDSGILSGYAHELIPDTITVMIAMPQRSRMRSGADEKRRLDPLREACPILDSSFPG